MITYEQRIQAYRTAPEHIIELCTSLETADLLGGVRKKYTIQNGDFILLVGDIILGLRPRGMIVQNLVSEIGLTSEVATIVAQELKPFFDKAEGFVISPTNTETKEPLELRPQIQSDTKVEIGETVGEPTNENTVKPFTREELMSALGGKRTMAQDIEALRQKREVNKVETPPAQAPEPPPPPRPQ